jgi:putative pyruvate formate lyase activating enzyme
MKLLEIEKSLYKILDKCVICPHSCKIDRKTGEKGFCGAGFEPVISSSIPHHGEEPPISGSGGSGTIFFSFCNMKCVYCQNYQISQEHEGIKTGIDRLADSMMMLQNLGCHNINFVSPTIWIPQIVKALSAARKKGLTVPTVFNTGGYDNPGIIKMLDGIIDIYMPDMRYSSNYMAEKYSIVKDYVRYNRQSVKEMYRQVGGLKLDSSGTAVKGLLIRLLVLPYDISGTKETLDYIRSELSTDVYLSIMAQYHPAYNAFDYHRLKRRITAKEYLEIVRYAEKKGFSFGWTQDHISLKVEEDLFMPDFKDKDIFKYHKK